MDISDVDLNLLKVYEALLIERNVSKAAMRLQLSQPATSAALARLRAIFADPLLIRRGNTMVATARAEELQPRIAAILDDLTHVFDAPGLFEPRESTRRFRVLANEYATLVLLAPLLSQLVREAPGIKIEILPFDVYFEEKLAAHDADLAISQSALLRRARSTSELLSDRYVTVARAEHSRIREGFSLGQFLSEDHVMITSVGRTTGNVDRALAAIGYSRRVALTVPHYLVAPGLIANSDLVMTVPQRIAEQFAKSWNLRFFEPPIELETINIAATWHHRSAADPAIAWLRAKIEECAARK